MQAIIETATGKVVFLVPDIDQLTLDDNGLSGAIRALDIKPATHHIETVTDNEDFIGGLWAWSGEWTQLDPVRIATIKGERISAEVTVAIQSMLDAKAKEHRYDSIHTACGWAAALPDATALKTWGAACWAKSFEIEQEVISGTRTINSVEDVMAEMPEFVG